MKQFFSILLGPDLFRLNFHLCVFRAIARFSFIIFIVFVLALLRNLLGDIFLLSILLYNLQLL